jgi:hypothetical protein
MKTRSDDEIVADVRKLLSRRWLYCALMLIAGAGLMVVGFLWVRLLIISGWEVTITHDFGAGLIVGLFVTSFCGGGGAVIIDGFRSMPPHADALKLLIRYHDKLKGTQN